MMERQSLAVRASNRARPIITEIVLTLQTKCHFRGISGSASR